MENTPYNRRIREQIQEINNRFLSHQNAVGREVLEDNLGIPAVPINTKYEGSGLLGMIFPPAQLLGLGEGGEKPSGLDIVNPKKTRGRPKKAGIIKTEPKKARGRPKKEAGAKAVGSKSKTVVSGNVGGARALGRAVGSGKSEMEGSGFFDSLASVAPLAMLALGKPKKGGKRGRPSKKAGNVGVEAMAEQKNLLTGNGKKATKQSKKAGGFFDDIVSSVGNVVKTAADVAPSALALAKMMKGKGIAEEKAGKKGGVKVKKAGSWIQHVKDYAKKNKISYKDALKEAKASYKK